MPICLTFKAYARSENDKKFLSIFKLSFVSYILNFPLYNSCSIFPTHPKYYTLLLTICASFEYKRLCITGIKKRYSYLSFVEKIFSFRKILKRFRISLLYLCTYGTLVSLVNAVTQHIYF